MENNGKNSVLPLVIISLVILLLVIGAYWFGKNSIIKNKAEEIAEVVEVKEEKTKESTESVTPEEENIEDKEDTDKDVEEESNEEVIETLKLLFAQKYGRRVEDAIVTISEREGDYIVGGIKFAGDIAGGYVLAAKVNDSWKIVFDGNGNFTCGVVDVVGFPSSLAPECWDENTMSVVDRTAR